MSDNNTEKIMPVGGQAVIEGVMMRSPKRIATAIRRASGEIEIKKQEYESLIQRKKISFYSYNLFLFTLRLCETTGRFPQLSSAFPSP